MKTTIKIQGYLFPTFNAAIDPIMTINGEVNIELVKILMEDISKNSSGQNEEDFGEVGGDQAFTAELLISYDSDDDGTWYDYEVVGVERVNK